METDLDTLVNEMERAFARRMGEAIAELLVQGKADHAERLAIAASRTIGDIVHYGIDETYFTHSWFYEERRYD
jgi:hypothetical protein